MEVQQQAKFLRTLSSAGHPCQYAQHAAVEDGALESGRVVFARVELTNSSNSGWIVYAMDTWRNAEGEVNVLNEHLELISTLDVVRQLNPLLVQALIVPLGGQLAYIKPRGDILLLGEHDLSRFTLFNPDDVTHEG